MSDKCPSSSNPDQSHSWIVIADEDVRDNVFYSQVVICIDCDQPKFDAWSQPIND